MTHVSDTSHIEKLGVAEVQSVCAKARVIFRPIATDDVGIDGFMELVEDGSVTGIIAGVQIKSGSSFVNDAGTTFKFQSDQEHFGYWARCSFPVIGVVFSPEHRKSIWLDLTGLATDKRISEGPYTITVEYGFKTAFTSANVLSKIVPTICKYTHQRRTLWQIQELIRPMQKKSSLLVPSVEVSTNKDEAWLELIEVFFAPSNRDEEIADAGYRLSWYFPAVSTKLKTVLKERLAKAEDCSLVRIIGVIHSLLEANAEHVAELITDLLKYVPDVTTRTERLLKGNTIPSIHREAAIQVIESIDEEFNAKLRDEIGY